MRVFIVMGFAAVGALAASRYVEDQGTPQEVAAAVPNDGADARPLTATLDHAASTQIASADAVATDAMDANPPNPVAAEASVQDATPTDATTLSSPAPAQAVVTEAETHASETKQASTEETSPHDGPEKTGAVTVASAVSDAPGAGGLINLNTASFEELNALPDAGPIARAIIKARPYASVEDLVKRKVIRRSVYEKIKDQVTVR